jgi:nitroreductase
VDVIQAIKSRQSVRNFSDKKVESEKITNILEMARLAPSFFNRQE